MNDRLGACIFTDLGHSNLQTWKGMRGNGPEHRDVTRIETTLRTKDIVKAKNGWEVIRKNTGTTCNVASMTAMATILHFNYVSTIL